MNLKRKGKYRIKITDDCCQNIWNAFRRKPEDQRVASVQITSLTDLGIPDEEVTVKFLDPLLYEIANGHGGRGHNAIKEYNFLSVIDDGPPKPYSTNKLGDFPKKEASDATQIQSRRSRQVQLPR